MERVGLGVEGSVVVGEIEEAVRLVDVEAASEATDGDRSAAAESTGAAEAATSAGAALRWAAGNQSRRLGALAKFFDAILKIFFAAGAEILAAALRAANADGFVGDVGAGSAHWQSGDVAGAGTATGGSAGTVQLDLCDRAAFETRIRDRCNRPAGAAVELCDAGVRDYGARGTVADSSGSSSQRDQ